MKIHVLILTFIVAGFSACKKSLDTGLSAEVRSGTGDCMPTFGPVSREFKRHTGRVFFIEKSMFDNGFKNGTPILELKKKSDSKLIVKGVLNIVLQPGSYVAVLDDTEYFDVFSDATVDIVPGQFISKNIDIFHCTSF